MGYICWCLLHIHTLVSELIKLNLYTWWPCFRLLWCLHFSSQLVGSEFNGGQGFQYEFHTSVGRLCVLVYSILSLPTSFLSPTHHQLQIQYGLSTSYQKKWAWGVTLLASTSLLWEVAWRVIPSVDWRSTMQLIPLPHSSPGRETRWDEQERLVTWCS